MRRSIALGAVMVLGALSMAAAAFQAQNQAPKVVEMEKLKENLYVLKSSSPQPRESFSGGNVAVFITDAGVVLVDTKVAGFGQTVLDKVKSVTSKPVTTIINTHTHADHTGNNDFFGATVDIVAHENTKANMAKMDLFKGEKAKFLPGKTFKDKMSLGTGRDRIDLYYFGPGHTGGDTWVVFPELRVLHTGDMFAWKDGPFCDRANGGSCVAFPETLSKGLAGIKNVDTIIPGHSPITTLKDLQEYQRFTADLLTETRAAIGAGKSVDDIAAASKLTGKYPGYQSERLKGAVQAIYDEIKK